MISHTEAYKGLRTVLAVIGGATCQLSEILQAIFPYASCLNNRQSKQGKEKKWCSREKGLWMNSHLPFKVTEPVKLRDI